MCFGLETENRLPHPYLKRNTTSGTKPPLWPVAPVGSSRAERAPRAGRARSDLRPGQENLSTASAGTSLNGDASWNRGRSQERLTEIGLLWMAQHRLSFIERVNLTIRHGIAPLARRTWATAQQSPQLLAHLVWWRAYYHFVCPHAAPRVALVQLRERGGKLMAQRYR